LRLAARILRSSAFALLLALALDCRTGPERLHSASYGGENAPYISESARVLERSEAPAHRLILIGDGGAPLRDDPTLAALHVWAEAAPGHTTVVFLGDNVYPDGLREEGRQRARGEAILRQQIQSTGAAKIFLPGNHDWGFSSRAMLHLHRLESEESFLEANAAARVDFAPKRGCPGPAVRRLVSPAAELTRGLTLIAVDFHWWLLPEGFRPHCGGIGSTSAFVDALEQELEIHAAENVVVVAHHPLRSGGPHGGFTRGFWTDIGASAFYRLSGSSLQDLWEPSYAQMVQVVSKALARHPPLAVAGGHDHSLQLIDGKDTARLLVVSGAASAGAITGVTAIDGTLFAHSHPGFVVFDFYRVNRGADALQVRVVETGRERPVYQLAYELPAAQDGGQSPSWTANGDQ